ncbi:TSUP family transporter [Candidatus Bathyarchaeota archaeon]|nr:TSUP family transporter [Candidatus Bathyarchaeota archaeon]
MKTLLRFLAFSPTVIAIHVQVFILAILTLSIVLKAALGFGNALVFISVVSLFMNTKSAIVLCATWGVWAGISNLIKYRACIDWKYTGKSYIASLPGVFIGSFLIVALDTAWIELVFALFVLSYVLIKLRTWTKSNPGRQAIVANKDGEQIQKDIEEVNESDALVDFFGKEIRQPEKNKERATGRQLGDYTMLPRIHPAFFYPGYFGFAFLGGLIGAAGPINVGLLDARNFQREEFVVNFSSTTLPLTFIGITVYLVNGLFPFELIWVWLLGFPCIYVGTRLGYHAVSKISPRKFQLMVYLMLLAIGLNTLIKTGIVLL